MLALPLLLVLALPHSAFAESFTVTTNKDIYSPDEKIIIIGAISEGAPDGYAVLIKVTGPSGDCTSRHLLPAADNSFISRSIRIDECGFGKFTVLASYADENTISTFIISNSSRTDAGSKLELRMLKNVIVQAQDSVNMRVKELIEDGYVLPENVARKYSGGVSEASLAIQAIEFDDAAGAKKHMILALRDFREVLNALSDEKLARFEQTAEQQAASNDNSDVVGTYNLLQRYYYRLVELAEKNQVDKEREFQATAQLLSNARQMINEDNFEGAALSLDRASVLLNEIRAELVEDEESEDNLVSANSTSPKDEDSVRKLIQAADRFERTALRLLNETSSAEAQTKLQEALSLIMDARVSIEAGELDSAREALSASYQAIEEAEDLIKDDGKTSTSEHNDKENSSSANNNDKENKDKNDKGSKDAEKKGQ